VDKESRARLSDAFESVTYNDGAEIVRQGDEGTFFFVIESGEVTVIKNDEVVNTLKAGQYFGELSLLNRIPRVATVKANGTVRCAVLPAEAFERLISYDTRTIMIEAANLYNEPQPHNLN